MTRRFASLLAAALIAALPVTAQEDVTYTPSGYPSSAQEATLHRPASGNGGAVIVVHGLGGTRQGALTMLWVNALLDEGYLVMAISYPDATSPFNTYPTPTRAIKTSVEYLRSRALDLSIDPDRIGAVGLSMGALLVSTAVVRDGDDDFLGTDADLDDHLAAAVLMYGLYDYENHLQSALPVAALLGLHFQTQANMDRASPVKNAAGISTPIFLAHGTADGTLSYMQSVTFHEALNSAGREVHYTEVAGGSHVFEANSDRSDFNADGASVFAEISAFLDAHLGAEATDVDPATEAPGRFVLRQNYPNPFNPLTTITYELGEAAVVRLELFNALGQKIRVLDSGHRRPGLHTVGVNASSLPSGLYGYRLATGSEAQTRMMQLIR